MILLSVLLYAAPAFSRPAHQGTARVQQPDGLYLTIRLVGDEYRSFNTTADGYTLTRNERGFYVYARLDADSCLAPTDFIARDSAERTPQDRDYLQRIGRWLTPRMNVEQAATMHRNRVARAKTLEQRRAAKYDYSMFRGLVILVEYNDCPFLYDDYADIMEKMLNQDNYTGESRTNIPYPYNIKCTGSMRDYFRDNSNGKFLPTFDIAGPVKINRSQYYPRPDGSNNSDNYVQLMKDAITAADELVNFKDYDLDNDGEVDMVYLIFSGLASYIESNDARLLWPHQSDLSWQNFRKDGVKLGRYACSTELFGYSEWNVLEGIGTMTHEFSHVLGLPDFYDTNNANQEACVNPGAWSVMANGADGNYGRTPINYSLFERYALDFATPEVITEPGEFSIEAIHKSNKGFRLNTPVRKEFFLLENRQKSKWDAVLPGHGMLIFRVDSTNSSAWYGNTVNDNPKHPYYELVRARDASSDDPSASTPRDPFPGTGRVTNINNDTEPANLLTWAKKRNEFGLMNITERNGVISFEAYYADVLTNIELPDSITIGFGTSMQLTPVFTPENPTITSMVWTSDNEDVATVSTDGIVRAVSVGTAVITVTGNENITASCVVTVRELDVLADIAAFRAMETGNTAQLMLNDAQVLFVNDKDAYVRDHSGSIMLSGTGLIADAGDRLNGPLFGRLDVVDRMPQLTAVENSTSTSGITVTKDTEALLPTEVNHNGVLTDDMLCDLVVARAVTIVLDNKKMFAEIGSQRAQIYNTFKLKGLSVPKSTAINGKYFDVTGILTTAAIGDTLTYVLSITDSIVEVEKPADIIKGDVNGDGTVDVADIAGIISVMAGEERLENTADVNGDGTVDVADISSVISIMADN